MNSLDRELQPIKKIVRESGLIPDLDFFKNRENRITLYRSNPKAFLSMSSDGTPTFPIKNQVNGISYTVLKRSLAAAKRRYNQTEDPQYLEFIEKIEKKIEELKNKTIKYPRFYKPAISLKSILNKTKRFDDIRSTFVIPGST